MKRKIILIIVVLLFNVLWINAISLTNDLASHYNLVIETKEKSLNNNTIIDDIDVMFENNLTYEGIDATVIGNKINTGLKGELSGNGELIAKYSIVNNINPFLVAGMIIENSDCGDTCSVLVTKCKNVGKLAYNKDIIGEASCFGGYYRSFNNIEDSIKAYIKFIRKNFYDKELTTPGSIYNSYHKDVGWAFRVNNFMEQMKNASV